MSAIENLRAARQTPHIALQEYIVLRSNSTDDFICVFEGMEDYPYYDTVLRIVRNDFKFKPLIVRGKDQVLGLRELLSKRNDPRSGNVAYFIDRDFDGYKTYSPAPNTYCTDGYSIENNLCDESVLPELLLSEYQCIKTDDATSVPRIVATFKERLHEFELLMAEANKMIFYARNNKIRLSAIENQISKYINIDLGGITMKPTSCHRELVGWPEDVDPTDVPLKITAFQSMTPLKDWRGKFVLNTYIELLHKLKDDRCALNPTLFKKRNPIKFNPKGDIIRTLAILAPIPDCLKQFVLQLGKSPSVPSASPEGAD